MEKAIFAPDDTVEIPCTVVGYPPPNITWFKVKRRQGRVIQTNLQTGKLEQTKSIDKK